jgi:hypothetical protein
MTCFQKAEMLLDEAERHSEAAKQAVLAHRDAEAEQHYQRARECRNQANQILDEAILAGSRAAS